MRQMEEIEYEKVIGSEIEFMQAMMIASFEFMPNTKETTYLLERRIIIDIGRDVNPDTNNGIYHNNIISYTVAWVT